MIMKKKTKKILRFPCFLASYCLSLDDKVNTIRYQQFTLTVCLYFWFSSILVVDVTVDNMIMQDILDSYR